MGQLRKLTASALLIGALLLVLLGPTGASAASTPPPLASATRLGVSHRHAAKSGHRAGACSSRRTSRGRRACRAARLRHHPKPAAPSASKVPVSAPISATPSAGRSTAAAVAAALAAPCPNTQLTPEEGNIELIRQAVMCLINQERAQHGIAPLRLSHQLEAAAEGHCSELISENYFAHVSPSGETPVDRVRTTGYIPGPSVGYVIGENLAWGTYSLATPQAIVTAWIASPAHLANILEAEYSETGIGITPAVPSSLAPGATGATYAQEFGAIVR